ncbi:methyltransferase domain-containing protein [Lentisalinibacter sediminis]|uniref:methyltransferase domain-containing protein n=1 Tax=Lentisalinibacter sediminis TaxID=2992237 RepID=UPI003866940E
MPGRSRYDDVRARRTERAYLSPEIERQREQTVQALAPAPGEFLLDVGCGPGLLTGGLADAVGPDGFVLGLDLSASMLALAAARCAGIPHIALTQADATSLPVRSGVADAVAATQVLLYVEQPETALAEIRRVLRPAGRVAIVETDWQTAVVTAQDADLTRRLFGAWDAAVPSPRLPQRLRPLLRDAGFGDVRVHAVPVLSTRLDNEGYAGTMIAQCAASAVAAGGVSDSEARAWRADLERRAEADEFLFCVNRFLFTAEPR